MKQVTKNEATAIELPEAVLGIMEQTLPDPDMVSYYQLAAQRKLYLDFEVNTDTMTIQRKIMLWNKEDEGIEPDQRQPIRLYIMSYGGDMDYMWAMVDTIEKSVTPVYTINIGIAASAAAIIFLAGHKRFMMPKSQMIIHEGSAELAGDAVKVFDGANSYKEAIKNMKHYILSRTAIPPAMLNRKRNNDWHLTADYCLEHGVCDRIVETLEEVL